MRLTVLILTLIFYFIIYQINGWRGVSAVAGAFVLFFVVILWSERPK